VIGVAKRVRDVRVDLRAGELGHIVVRIVPAVLEVADRDAHAAPARLCPRVLGVDAAGEAGRGVLVATAHLGNWELSAFAHALNSWK
jgi:hypothetical protein